MLHLLVFGMYLVTSIWLAWFLVTRDRGSKEPRGTLIMAGAFGLLAVFAAAFLEAKFLGWLPESGDASVLMLVGFLLVGFIEEAAKFVPLAYWIYRKPEFNELTDGIIYFALCGLVFGFVENIGYLLSGGVFVGIMRVFILLFFHAATAAIVIEPLKNEQITPWLQSPRQPVSAFRSNLGKRRVGQT